MAVRKHIQTQTEWENQMAGQVLELIKSELYLDLPFMGIALGKLAPAAKEGLQTFATDGVNGWYSSDQLLRVFRTNPKFLDRIYLHMVLHCIFSHLWVRGQRNRSLWNIACDIAVEYTIDGLDKPCTRRILTYVRQKTYEELKALPDGISAATVYLWLLEQTADYRMILQREFVADDHRFWPDEEKRQASPNETTSPEKEWRQTARQTRLEQKKKGSESSEGEQMMAALLSAQKSRRSYRDFLRKFAVLREELQVNPDEFDLSYYTYGLRIYGNMPLIEPLESKETRKIREFVIVLDTSYSTSGELVTSFLKETYTLLSQTDNFFHRSRIRVLQCDDRVRMDALITSDSQMEALLQKFTLVGGGGTDFRPAFAYVNDLIDRGELKELSGLLYFTDGKGIYPKKRPPFKTAFLYLRDYEADKVPAWAIQYQLEPAEFLDQPDATLAGGDIFAGAGGGPAADKSANKLESDFNDWDEDEILDLPNT